MKDELVCFEEILRSSGVLPPPLYFLDVYLGSLGQECLEGVSDLQYASQGGFYLFDGIEGRVVEDCDAVSDSVADLCGSSVMEE